LLPSHGRMDPQRISPQEPIARYLLSRRHFSPERGRAKSRAFLPPADTLGTSVFRIYSLRDSEVWDLGEKHVAAPIGRTLHGRADLLASQIEVIGLRLKPDNVPERHADIVGWPQAKDEQLSLAQELAEVAVLRLRP